LQQGLVIAEHTNRCLVVGINQPITPRSKNWGPYWWVCFFWTMNLYDHLSSLCSFSTVYWRADFRNKIYDFIVVCNLCF
jgi:hypothetical protein